MFFFLNVKNLKTFQFFKNSVDVPIKEKIFAGPKWLKENLFKGGTWHPIHN